MLFRPYLEGTRLTVFNDYSALRWILNVADATGKLVRWALQLPKFQFDVVHRFGVKHQAGDALLRLETDGLEGSPVDDGIPVQEIEQKLTCLIERDIGRPFCP